MAIATSTALTAAALAASGASAGISFAQAGKQQKLQKEAEAAAEAALAEARKKIDLNYYEQLGINKEPYDLQREAMLASGAQAIAAGVESERGAAGIAGAVQMAQNKEQQQIASQMGTELRNLDQLVATEDARIAGKLAELDLAEATGAQLAARDAQEAAAAFKTQGIQSGIEFAKNAVTLAPLYSKTDIKTDTKTDVDANTVPYNLSQKQFAPNAVNPNLSNTQIPFNYGVVPPSTNPSLGQIQYNGLFDPRTGFRANIGTGFSIPSTAFDMPSLGGNNDSLFQEFLQWKKAKNR